MDALSMPLIHVQDLRKRFGSLAAVDGVTFSIPRGETVVLWGDNGAGKTTVLRCVLGLLPFEGVIRVAGEDVRRRGKDVRRRIGYVPQDVRFHAHETVWETIRFYAQLRAVPMRSAEARLREWGLQDALAQRVGTLSGGMRQRLALAIALLSDPSVLLLDEPASSLDVKTKRDLNVHLEQLKANGKTLVLCSHQTADVWRLADRVLVLSHGRLIAQGSPNAMAGLLGEELNAESLPEWRT